MTHLEKFKTGQLVIRNPKSPEHCPKIRKIMNFLGFKIAYDGSANYYKMPKGDESGYYYSLPEGDYDVIDAQDFILDEPKTETMNKLTREQLKGLYDTFTCSTFREGITKIVAEDIFATEFVITDEVLKELETKGTSAQKRAVTVLGIIFPNMGLKEILKGSLYTEVGLGGAIQPRNGGQYHDKGFYLSPQFDWELEKDDSGGEECFVLIPKRKFF